MKKILFITTRDPYSGRYSGDVRRAVKVIKYLKKTNKVDVIYLTKKKQFHKKTELKYQFYYPNFILKIFYCFVSILKINPIQYGVFFSRDMSNFVKNNAKNYDILFFHHMRSSQYLPKNYTGKTILEMGDLYSDNYSQTYKNLNILNPLKYIYFIESMLVKKAEDKLFSTFNRIILFSKNEVRSIKKKFKNKVFYIPETIEKINKKYFFSKKNYKILFIGNLGYLPNILACKDFVKNILPNVLKINSNIKFYIIGNIKTFDRLLFSFDKNVKVLGTQKKLGKYIKNSICGLSNLKIATGVQGKILTYMSFGLPVLSSERTASNFNDDVLSYRNNEDLIKKILKFKKEKKLCNKYSKKSNKCIKKFLWKKIRREYLKVTKFNK
jgi:hypothetical protein